MQIYKTKSFARFVRKERIADAILVEATQRADQGLIDADLGGGLIKQRVARSGQGRRGSYRTILIYRAGSLAVFIAGFAKGELANIADDDLDDLRILARRWLANPDWIQKDLAIGILNEVKHDEQT